jgi:glyoxylase I family protein
MGGIDRSAQSTRMLLVRRGRLDALRTAASLSATIVFLSACYESNVHLCAESAMRGSMNRSDLQPSDEVREDSSTANKSQNFIQELWGVRYQVRDVGRAVAFYTQQLGFKLDQQNPPAFAQVSIGNLKLILSGPGASGSRPMPDGRSQEPGGWNRVILHVVNLPAQVEALRKAGLHFRNSMEGGPGGRQIQLEDPDGNPIELFEPAR